MNALRTLIQHNRAYLDQIRLLIGSLDDADYTSARAPHVASSTGDHVRHVLEHYECFLAGVQSRTIDYDGRSRDRRVATDRSAALRLIERLSEGLHDLGGTDSEVQVCLDGSHDASDADPWSRSTLRRELQYLQAHTVHHFALIAVLLSMLECETPPGFGIAPSTIRHNRTSEATTAVR